MPSNFVEMKPQCSEWMLIPDENIPLSLFLKNLFLKPVR